MRIGLAKLHSESICARKRYVLNAVFAFVFSPSPLKLVKCNK